MAKNDLTLFEGLVGDDPAAIKIINSFVLKQIQIVSPTVSGLLENFSFKDKDSLGIASCGSGFESNVINGVDTVITDDKENESAHVSGFADSAGVFVKKVIDMRSSFLPALWINSATNTTMSIDTLQQTESYENAFMRMLGMPDSADIGDLSAQLFYVDPSDGIKLRVATLGEIIGENTNKSSEFADILMERQRLPGNGTANTGNRKYDFTSVSILYTGPEIEEKLKELALHNDAFLNQQISVGVNYYNPNDLGKFFYLKSVPLQDSRIYGCVSEVEKIVSKPFDDISGNTIDGKKIHSSLLETILRIRLDRVTGDPGIYSDDLTGSVTSLISPANTGDKLTQVECFLIEKLKKILFQLGEKYIRDGISMNEDVAKENNETGTETIAEKAATRVVLSAEDISKKETTLKNLQILKAKEDAILFLLKDTSSSTDLGNDSMFSSLDIQERTIRTASGFQDILSGPLLSLISQRSVYLGTKIEELRGIIDAARVKEKTASLKDKADLLSIRDDKVTVAYLGISSEDFIIYLLALLSINQDYLIGLLSKERRVSLANTISATSYISKTKDPYGLLDKISKGPQETGGFPSVIDSVNALTLLVFKLYNSYIDAVKYNTAGLEDAYIKYVAATKNTKET